jgi:hypothetical protein
MLPAAAVLMMLLSGNAIAAAAPSGWALQATPNPVGARNTFLAGVSCTAPTACVAVGYSISTSNAVTTLAEQWNGSAWSILSTPSPVGSVISSLAAVACTSATACTAVGDSFNAANVKSTLDERWNGTTWSVQPTPDPAGASNSTLVGVACRVSTSCIAVGSYTKTPSGHPFTLAESWNGIAWSIVTTPNPPANRGASLLSVACSSGSACTAVGNWFNSSNTEVTLAERWSGTAWSIQTTLNPTTHLSELFGVACSSATSCMAVGSDINTSILQVALVERWNGSTWSVVATPGIAGSQGAALQAISCATVKGCNAVGDNINGAGVEVTLAEKWNGTAWSVKATPNPATATASDLLAVSCTTKACTASGAYSTSSPPSLNDKTLAEQT